MTSVEPAIVDAVKASKARCRASAVQYAEHPRLGLIVHSFNRVANVAQLAGGLRALGHHELIVCEDGSVDGSCEMWLALLDRPTTC